MNFFHGLEPHDAPQPALTGADAPLSGGIGAPDAADEADDRQLQMLQDELRAMSAKAAEIETQARQLEMETGVATAEVHHAHQQAATMRAASEQAKSEIGSAARDPKTGKKRISTSKVAALTSSLSQIIADGSAESNVLAEATELAHAAKESVLNAKASAAKPVGVIAHVQRACHGVACAVGLTTPHGTHAPEGFLSSAGRSFKSMIGSIGHGFGQFFGGVSAGIATMGDAIIHSGPARALGAFIADPVGSIRHGAHAVKEGVVVAARAVGGAVQATVVAPVVAMYHGARQAVQGVVDTVNQTLAKMGGGAAPHPHAHKPPLLVHASHPEGAMLRALHQAMALKLPQHPLEDAMELLSPMVPNLLTHPLQLTHNR